MRKYIIMVMTIGFIAMYNNLMAQHHHGAHHPNGHHHGGKLSNVQNNRHSIVSATEMQSYHRNNAVVVRERNIRSVPILPPGYSSITFRERNYFYHGGLFYNYIGNTYSVIAPPIGIRIRELPMGYTRIVFGGIPHYYYMGAYYRGDGSEYETVEPTMGMIVPELPQDNVQQVTINGINYYEYDNILYKEVVTNNGVRYKVVGKLSD